MTYKQQYRHTINGALSFTSSGIHSGKTSKLSLFPALPNTGIVFKRMDLKNAHSIKIQYDSVVDTTLSTKIAGNDGHTVSTIEHIMSALCACGIDDVEIQLHGEEVPIMDGSSKDFTNRILALGVRQSSTARQYIKILKPVSVTKGHSTITLSPHEGFVIDAQIHFDKGGIGTQTMTFDFDKNCYKSEISPARTFGFHSDIAHLQKMGLALGGGLHNAVVYCETGTEQSLRLEKECIAHKILDVIGDLYVTGMPLLCRVEAQCMGHEINNAILHKIFSDSTNFEIV